RIGQNPAAITDFRFGTSGRNTVTGPGIASLDASVNKAFTWSEGRQKVDLRGEFFNLPNHPNFAQPGSTLRTATYGVISGTRIDSRQIQLALRYSF
ncbi:MAG: Cna domain protein, partial [Bryobacterales bacterium]|nr:Cna domain protein [Bryobacterales bacterium]